MSITHRIIMPYRYHAASAAAFGSATTVRDRRRRNRNTYARTAPGSFRRNTARADYGRLDLVNDHLARYGYEIHDVFDQFESPR